MCSGPGAGNLKLPTMYAISSYSTSSSSAPAAHMSNVFGHTFSVLRFRDCGFFVVRIFLEVLHMWDSYSCACACSAIAIILATRGTFLKVSSSGGSSSNETSWAISARVLTWKVLVRLMTMGIILTSAFRVP
jgi:hypothetical protein